MIRLAIRGFANGVRQFEERIAVEETGIDRLIPELGEKHARALVAHELHMIEIEFLDEPDPMTRFFRFGTDPSDMAIPILLDLADPDIIGAAKKASAKRAGKSPWN